MGKIKHLFKIREFLKKTPVFSARDIELLIKDKKYAHLLLHNLAKKNEIFRLQKGCYSVLSDPIFSVFCFKPAYLGLQEALSLHNLWEQETNPVIITSKKARQGLRKILESNVVVRRLKPKYFFGFEHLKYDKFFLPVSDVEKTLLDFLYFQEILAKETIKEIKEKINLAKLNSYLKFYPSDFRKAVENILKK